LDEIAGEGDLSRLPFFLEGLGDSRIFSFSPPPFWREKGDARNIFFSAIREDIQRIVKGLVPLFPPLLRGGKHVKRRDVITGAALPYIELRGKIRSFSANPSFLFPIKRRLKIDLLKLCRGSSFLRSPIETVEESMNWGVRSFIPLSPTSMLRDRIKSSSPFVFSPF